MVNERDCLVFLIQYFLNYSFVECFAISFSENTLSFSNLADILFKVLGLRKMNKELASKSRKSLLECRSVTRKQVRAKRKCVR